MVGAATPQCNKVTAETSSEESKAVNHKCSNSRMATDSSKRTCRSRSKRVQRIAGLTADAKKNNNCERFCAKKRRVGQRTTESINAIKMQRVNCDNSVMMF